MVRRELLLLDPVVRADVGRVRGLLHPDFVEFGASGRIWDGVTLVEALAANSVPLGHGAAVDLTPVSLSADTVLLTYRIDQQARSSLRSSVWLRSAESEWLLVSTKAPGRHRVGLCEAAGIVDAVVHHVWGCFFSWLNVIH